MDGVKARDWMIPAMMLASCLSLLLWLNDQSWSGSLYCMGAVVMVMFVLAVQTWKAYAAFWGQVANDQFRARREAMSLTSEGRWAESFRGMHPETARLVLSYSKTVWLIDECEVGDVCEWRLAADQRINARFVVWVLQNSNPYSIYPMHGNLNDGKHTWDRVVSDRLMYQAFCAVLVRRQMLTDANGNQPGLWIEPWNPQRAAKRFGVLHLMEEEGEEEEVKVVGEQ